MEEPRWLVDEMLGRLARYLRFLGYDAAYVRGVTDDAIVNQVRAEERRLITRDRALANRLPDAILLSRTDIAGQVRQLGAKFPALRHEVRFDRCSVCNGPLRPVPSPGSLDGRAGETPRSVREGTSPLFSCTLCGHVYWEGSHTRDVRARLMQWREPELRRD